MEREEEKRKIREMMRGYASVFATWSNELLRIYETEGVAAFWRMYKMVVRIYPRAIKAKALPAIQEVDKGLAERMRAIETSTLGDRYSKTKEQTMEEHIYLEQRGLEVFSMTEDLLDEAGFKVVGEVEPRRPSKAKRMEVPEV